MTTRTIYRLKTISHINYTQVSVSTTEKIIPASTMEKILLCRRYLGHRRATNMVEEEEEDHIITVVEEEEEDQVIMVVEEVKEGGIILERQWKKNINTLFKPNS